MNGLEAKTLLIGLLKIRQKQYIKVFVLVLLFAFHCRLNPTLHANETLLEQTQSHKHQSFVSRALNISGDAVVTIETERKIVSSRETLFPPGILNDPYFERFFGL